MTDELQPALFDGDQYLSHQARLQLAGYPCAHCGRSTLEHDAGPLYMVHDQVWAAAGFESYEFACIGCLEVRLGRPLSRDDFPDVLANHWGILSTSGPESG